jgi:NADH:ubiquinone oxidoreductase subunit 2 (subunit N)
LEVNTLSFCSIITERVENQSSGGKESSMKYFVIQSVASAVLIIYMSFQKDLPVIELFFLAGTSAVLIKLAASPFHG